MGGSAPLISVVIPVFNVEKYLRENLDSILAQTEKNFEVICVDDGSTDASGRILDEYAQKDGRIIPIHQENKGCGAARNIGMLSVRGKYVIFLDADDLFRDTMLEKTVAKAEETGADLVAFNFSRFDESGHEKNCTGFHADWIEGKVFNYRQCPDRIMSVVNPTPWNRLYRTDFIRKHGLKFDEISSSEDISFGAVTSAYAEKITWLEDSLLRYRVGHEGTLTSTRPWKLKNVIAAVESAIRQVGALPYRDKIRQACVRFAVENYIYSLEHDIPDFNADNVREFYDYVHREFNSAPYKEVTAENLYNDRMYCTFLAVKSRTYPEMQALKSRKLIVSVTSYPARIKYVAGMLETIYSQIRVPDEVLLWLAEEQFPGKELDLPEELLSFQKDKGLIIRWCDDLKCHKKYFYTMQENPEAVVITVDDDIRYQNDTIERLYWGYLAFPEAVSACRVHLATFDEQGSLLPYDCWLPDIGSRLYEPSMQLVAIGCSGILYPPGLLDQKLFDSEGIRKTCLFADDLWLKAIECISGVPVVQVAPARYLSYVPGSQENALWHSNVTGNQNDRQLTDIRDYLSAEFGDGFLEKSMTVCSYGFRILSIEELCRLFRAEGSILKDQEKRTSSLLQKTYVEKSAINAKLQRTYAEKSELNAKLQRTYDEKSELTIKLKKTYDEKSELNARLQKTYDEKSELNAKLQKTYDEKSELNAKLKQTYKDKTERGQRIKELEKELEEERNRGIVDHIRQKLRKKEP